MDKIISKVTSRKFLISVAGIVSGIVLLCNGDTTEGVTSIIASVVAYLAAEGIVDMAAVKQTAKKIEAVTEQIDGDTEAAPQSATIITEDNTTPDDYGGTCD